jgi:hypothetical protein
MTRAIRTTALTALCLAVAGTGLVGCSDVRSGLEDAGAGLEGVESGLASAAEDVMTDGELFAATTSTPTSPSWPSRPSGASPTGPPPDGVGGSALSAAPRTARAPGGTGPGGPAGPASAGSHGRSRALREPGRRTWTVGASPEPCPDTQTGPSRRPEVIRW